MDKLPPEIHCVIFSHVDFLDQLNLRIVCRSLNQAFLHNMARTSIVTINSFKVRESWFIHALFLKKDTLHLHFNHFKLGPAFLNFIARMCPNIKVLSTSDRRIDPVNFEKVASKLTYFESPSSIKNKDTVQRLKQCLRSFVALSVENKDMCICQSLVPVIQYNDLCRVKSPLHLPIDQMSTFANITWLHLESTEPPNYFPSIPNLLVLTIRLKSEQPEDRNYSFFYPKLRYFELVNCQRGYFAQPVGKPPFCPQIIRSLKDSRKLESIVLKAESEWFNLEDLLDLTCTKLRFLRRMKIDFKSSATGTQSIFMNPNLLALELTLDKPFIFNTFNENIKYLSLHIEHSCPGFHFAILEEANITYGKCKDLRPVIRSLGRSPRLKQCRISAMETDHRSISRFFDFIGQNRQLENIVLEVDYVFNWDTTEQATIDVSRHYNVKLLDVQFNFPHPFNVVIGAPGYDHLHIDDMYVVLRKTRASGLATYFNVDSAGGKFKISPEASIKTVYFGHAQYQNFKSIHLEEMKIDIECYGSVSDEIYKLGKSLKSVESLKNFSLSIRPTDLQEGVQREDIIVFLQILSQVKGLKKIYLDLSIDVPRRNEMRLAFHPCDLFLEELHIKICPRNVKLLLPLNNYYTKIHFTSQTSDESVAIEGETTDNRPTRMILPANTEVLFNKKMNSLRDVCISSWSLPTKMFSSCYDLSYLTSRISPQLIHDLLQKFNSPNALNLEINHPHAKPARTVHAFLEKLLLKGEIASYKLNGPKD